MITTDHLHALGEAASEMMIEAADEIAMAARYQPGTASYARHMARAVAASRTAHLLRVIASFTAEALAANDPA